MVKKPLTKSPIDLTGLRKFSFCMLLGILATLLLIFKFIKEGVWLDVIKWAAGFFISSNVATNITGTIGRVLGGRGQEEASTKED